MNKDVDLKCTSSMSRIDCVRDSEEVRYNGWRMLKIMDKMSALVGCVYSSGGTSI